MDMAEAAHFYYAHREEDTTRPAVRTNPLETPPPRQQKPVSKRSRRGSLELKHTIRPKASSTSTSASTQSSSSKTSTSDIVISNLNYMLSTPLIDYKHAANQTNKARAAKARAVAAAKARTSSSTSTSANSAERKHALQSAEARTVVARADTALLRSDSHSSTTGSSGLTAVTSSEPTSNDEALSRPFRGENGRRYLRDTTSPYPLPCDLAEIHRQTLRTILLCQVFNGPVCSPALQVKPPKRVLEVGCGTGFWSVMCHRHFSQRGFSSISFTGIDIAPLAPRLDTDDDMNWRFVQHDLRKTPLPFRDEEFNLIMIKDLSMVTPTTGMQQTLMDEYLRILKPGGSLEIWDGDHSLRMLLPHAPPPTKDDDDESEDEDQVYTNAMGTYTMTRQTPLAAPQNTFLNDYNGWISKALETRKLTPMPCTSILPMLLQESDALTGIDCRRLAIPLGEVRWEREGVGGAVTQGSNGNLISSKGKTRDSDQKTLTPGQLALRRTALMTVVQMIESLEPLLKEASGKKQDEWDRWHDNMMNDLLNHNGTSWGECLEVGAWWARKNKPTT